MVLSIYIRYDLAMKPTCPRCGFNLEDDRDTVIDARLSSPSIPRLSDIDRRWDMSVHEEPTRMQDVPVFTMPESMLRKKEVAFSQRPTPLRPPPVASRRPRPGFVIALFMVLGLGLGALLVENQWRIFRLYDEVRQFMSHRSS